MTHVDAYMDKTIKHLCVYAQEKMKNKVWSAMVVNAELVEFHVENGCGVFTYENVMPEGTATYRFYIREWMEYLYAGLEAFEKVRGCLVEIRGFMARYKDFIGWEDIDWRVHRDRENGLLMVTYA
jgi:hypothetical protein